MALQYVLIAGEASSEFSRGIRKPEFCVKYSNMLVLARVHSIKHRVSQIRLVQGLAQAYGRQLADAAESFPCEPDHVLVCLWVCSAGEERVQG